MVNQSKKNSKLFWAKWKTSGATGGIEEAIAIELANKGELVIGEISQPYVGLDAGNRFYILE